MTEDVRLKIQTWFDVVYAGQPVKNNPNNQIISEITDMIYDDFKYEINQENEPYIYMTAIPKSWARNVYDICLVRDVGERAYILAPILCVILHRTNKGLWKECSCGSYRENIEEDILKNAEKLRRVKEC